MKQALKAFGGSLGILALGLALTLGNPTFPVSPTGHTWHTGNVGNRLFIQSTPRALLQSNPPECVKLRIIENGGNGPTLYLLACGTGGQGESPVFDSVSSLGPLIVDGNTISPADCTRLSRCVVLWPLSPLEGKEEN